MTDKTITVVGAGLAGCEAAWAAANAGVSVTLIEMKPLCRSPAHTADGFAELVCSNSLKSNRPDSAAGLLKNEMRQLGSVCLQAADDCAVPAGGALAVDRERFSPLVTEKIQNHPHIRVVHEEITHIPDGTAVIATGPLTDGALAEDIRRLCGEGLHFYDAAAPIVSADSIDMNSAFRASRYGGISSPGEEGEGDYINCPLDKAEYELFHAALISAETAPLHEFDGNPTVYEGCMPIEVLAKRGLDAIRFGPMKPVGLRDPRTGRRPWAVLQLRAENAAGTMYNLVGFQTNLRFPEQKRVFGLIPALQNAAFLRYGVMHRNTFLNSPQLLNAAYQFKTRDSLFFAGQMTGVEGYMESAASGILAGLNAAKCLQGKPLYTLPVETMMGTLANYISAENKDFQPMGANFGLLPPIEPHIRDKRQRYAMLADRGMAKLEEYFNNMEA